MLRTTSVTDNGEILVKCHVMVSLTNGAVFASCCIFNISAGGIFKVCMQFDMEEIAFERVDNILAISVD